MTFLHLLSFYDARTGTHNLTRSIPYAPRADPQFKLSAVRVPYSYSLLWHPDASGVFVLDSQKALFVSVGGQVRTADRVPEHPVPTRGGVVSGSGQWLSLSGEGAKARITVTRLPGWTAFENNPLVPFGKQRYTF